MRMINLFRLASSRQDLDQQQYRVLNKLLVARPDKDILNLMEMFLYLSDFKENAGPLGVTWQRKYGRLLASTIKRSGSLLASKKNGLLKTRQSSSTTEKTKGLLRGIEAQDGTVVDEKS